MLSQSEELFRVTEKVDEDGGNQHAHLLGRMVHELRDTALHRAEASIRQDNVPEGDNLFFAGVFDKKGDGGKGFTLHQGAVPPTFLFPI